MHCPSPRIPPLTTAFPPSFLSFTLEDPQGREMGVKGTNEGRREAGTGREKEESRWETSVKGVVNLGDRGTWGGE